MVHCEGQGFGVGVLVSLEGCESHGKVLCLVFKGLYLTVSLRVEGQGSWFRGPSLGLAQGLKG